MNELLAVAQLGVMAVVLRRMAIELGLYDPARGRLYCHEAGQGPSILLLHGLAGSWRYWRRGLAQLSRDYTVYAPDLVGFGRSAKPRGHYSPAMHVEALGRLLDGEKEMSIVVGHSMGAILALHVYARYPARIGRVVLIGLPCFPARAVAETWLARSSVMNRLMISGSRLAEIMCYMKDLWALPVFAPLVGAPLDLYRDYWKHTWNSASQSLLNTVLAFEPRRLLENVDRTKVTLVHGVADDVAPIEHVRCLVEQFPDLALREVEGDHHAYLAHPDVLNRLIAGHVDRSGATKRVAEAVR